MAESPLEVLPPELRSVRSIAVHAYAVGRRVDQILLDRSYHHKWMGRLKDADRRGRPDIVHFSLLEATSTPLYAKEELSVYVHTCRDTMIEVGKKVRLPKTYARFEGLMVNLFRDRRVPETGEALLKLIENGFSGLVSSLRPSLTIGLSTQGTRSNFEEVASRLTRQEKPVLVVGGFPRGHFSPHVRGVMDEIYSVCGMSLEAHVVVARTLYEYEKAAEVTC